MSRCNFPHRGKNGNMLIKKLRQVSQMYFATDRQNAIDFVGKVSVGL